jgi:hypothetical protein
LIHCSKKQLLRSKRTGRIQETGFGNFSKDENGNSSEIASLRIPMHPAMHSNMKPAGDSDLIPATLLASTGPFR